LKKELAGTIEPPPEYITSWPFDLAYGPDNCLYLTGYTPGFPREFRPNRLDCILFKVDVDGM